MKASKHTGKRLAALVAATGLLATLAACSDDSPSTEGGGETPTIRIATAVDNFYGFMPVIAEESLKTFEDSGVNVEVVSATTPTIGQVMAGGQADMALAGTGALVAQSVSGVPIKLVAGILNPWDYYVIVSNEGNFAGASSIEELKGANFGITGQGSPGNYMLSQYAEELGWSSSDFKETALGDVGSLFAGLAAGTVDAVLWAPDQAYITEAEGVATHFPLPDLTPNVLQGMAASNELLEENPQAVKDVLTAYYAKVEELQQNPEIFIDVLVNEWDIDPDVADRLAENQLPLLSTDGAISEEEAAGVAQSVPFLSGDPDAEPPKLEIEPWQELGS